MSTAPTFDQASRIPVADPESMRRGARRSVFVGVILLILLTGFTVGGASILAAGELPGLPFTVGGAVAQLSVVSLNVAALRVRSSLDGRTVSRVAVHTARRVLAISYAVLLLTTGGLVSYALLRVAFGDLATLLTTAIISVPLWLLLRGTGRARTGVAGMANGAPATWVT